MTISQFSFPTAITFGPESRRLVVDHLRLHQIERPLVVTDNGVSSLPFFADLVANYAAGGLDPAIFDGVVGNPKKSQVTAGTAAYRTHGADGIIGIGGGAALDVAKAIALMSDHPGDLFDYEDELPGARPIGPVPHFVAIPTTAGTGSEVGRSAVISDDVTHVKHIIYSPHLLADAVFADPELTVGLPADITAATGIDALTHNIEAYLAKAFHPICDGIALEGLRLGAAHLARAVAVPDDIEARGGMLMSSMMGAIAFQKGLGVVHSTAHALGTVADFHHGLANAVMIDHALAFNAETSASRFAVMAQVIALDEASPDAFLRWISQLKNEIGLPRSLADTSVSPDSIEQLTDVAFADSCHLNNPRPVTRDDCYRIFLEAFA
ncbi:MAG: iron-containing alcohol dehydrogenase [Actinomycetes bacterium]